MGETSAINDLVTLHGTKRKTTSIYIDPLIFKAFYKRCRDIGTSSCSVLEAFMYAYVKGTSSVPSSPLPVVNVNLTINRVVKREIREFGSKSKDIEFKARNIPMVDSKGNITGVIKAYPDVNMLRKMQRVKDEDL